MKITIHLLILSLLLVTGCSHQKSVNPSSEVITSFESKFGKEYQLQNGNYLLISPMWPILQFPAIL